MANLKAGTLIGGNLIWHQGNLPLQTVDDAIFVSTKEGSKEIYHEGHKPTNEELNLVSRAGDTMTGILKFSVSLSDVIQDASGNRLLHNGGFVVLGNTKKTSAIDGGSTRLTVQNGSVHSTSPFLTAAAQSSAGNSLTRKDYVDTKLALSGGTMTGLLTIAAANGGLTIRGTNNATYILGQGSDSSNNWFVGKGSHASDDIALTSYKYARAVNIKSDGVHVVGSGQSGKIYTTGYKPALDDLTGKAVLAEKANSLVNVSPTTTTYNWDTFIPEEFKLITANDGAPEGITSHGFFLPHSATYGSSYGSQYAARDNRFWMRSRRNGVWMSWSELYTTNHKPTPEEVGALPANGKAVDSDKLDGLDSSQFLRSDANDSFSGDLVSTSRHKGLFGTYDSNKTDQIWSMGTAYRNDPQGADFGNLYGLAYKHTHNTTGGTMAGGHQMVWCTNGSPKAALGESGIWTSGYLQSGSATIDYFNIDGQDLRIHGKRAVVGTSDSLYLSYGGDYANDQVYINSGRIYHENHKPTPSELGVVAGYQRSNLTTSGAVGIDYGWVNGGTTGGGSITRYTGNFINVAGANSHTSQLIIGANDMQFRTQWGSTPSEWCKVYHTNYKPTNNDLNLVSRAGDTMTGALIFSGHNGVSVDYKGSTKRVLWHHGNGNVTLSASSTSGILHLGYTNSADYQTGKIALHQRLFASNGTTLICDATGQLYDLGTRVYSEHHKPTPSEVGAVNKAGDTMTGNLSISKSVPAIFLRNTDDGNRLWKFEASTGHVRITESGIGYPIVMKAGAETIIRKPRALDSQENNDAALTRKDYVDNRSWSKTEAPNLSHVGLTSDIKWKATGATVSGTEDVDFNELGGNAGTYYRLTSNASTNRPDNKTGFSYLMSFKYGSTTNTTQLSIPYSVSGNSGRIAFRGMYSGEWNDWEYLYSTNNKPTWADVGGENYWKIEESTDHIIAQSGWVRASGNSTGFIPFSDSNSSLGTGSWKFKEAWVNTYNGSAINLTGLGSSVLLNNPESRDQRIVSTGRGTNNWYIGASSDNTDTNWYNYHGQGHITIVGDGNINYNCGAGKQHTFNGLIYTHSVLSTTDMYIRKDGRKHLIFENASGQAVGYVYCDDNGDVQMSRGINGGATTALTVECLAVDGSAGQSGTLRTSGTNYGGWDSWQTRGAALGINTANMDSSAMGIWKATTWGVSHWGCMDIHVPGHTINNVEIRLVAGNNEYRWGGAGFRTKGVIIESDKVEEVRPLFITKTATSALDIISGIQSNMVTRSDNQNDEARISIKPSSVKTALPAAYHEFVDTTHPKDARTPAKVTEGIDLAALVAIQMEAIKELRAEIEYLKSK